MADGHFEIDDILGPEPDAPTFNGADREIFTEQITQRRALRWLGHEVQAFKERADIRTLQTEVRIGKWLGAAILLVLLGSIIERAVM